MRRREFSFAFGSLVAACPLTSHAQQATRPLRIGVLAQAPFSNFVFPKQFPPALAKRGYREGIDVAIDWRSAEGDAEALPNLAKGLVAAGVVLIIAVANSETIAARAATRTIPIVMLAAVNPVEAGLIDSLARPGGNVTGSAWLASETAGKALQVLKEAVPQTRRVGYVFSAEAPEQRMYADAMETVASALGVTFERVEVERGEDGVHALRRFHQGEGDSLVVTGNGGRLDAVLGYAARHHLPTLCTQRGGFEAGGLIGYIPSAVEVVARTALYVDRILKGTHPRELPVEQPSRLELVVNLKTAKALGVRIPDVLLARADEVIE